MTGGTAQRLRLANRPSSLGAGIKYTRACTFCYSQTTNINHIRNRFIPNGKGDSRDEYVIAMVLAYVNLAATKIRPTISFIKHAEGRYRHTLTHTPAEAIIDNMKTSISLALLVVIVASFVSSAER